MPSLHTIFRVAFALTKHNQPFDPKHSGFRLPLRFDLFAKPNGINRPFGPPYRQVGLEGSIFARHIYSRKVFFQKVL